ncbi:MULTISPECIES: DUF3800 domain-containing protein [unclassified Methanoregula]|uniref:DUF3800 domain-containing protein n=1 Tax=unclassified Methanoregula TaxID=2649730 RepID=UPI0009C46D1A|nr:MULTISPECIES: DUF3800 domain-containing protein [unclassified Methanoregula]OPX65519.1 MAG: hypothetical protein A4E33_00060 [Methanoregula sp. PtaB.Bin085]OPY35799.1 MAG: hypothetical protein A4E34_00475 [Methanoregula sp. PtaU1.Bin006]
MGIYFAFSDESGQYRQYRTDEYNQRNPYYLRSTLIIDGESWFFLDNCFKELKEEYQIPHETEIKYADIWTLYRYQREPTRQLATRLTPFQDYPIDHIEQFILDSFRILDALPYANIIITISKNDAIGRIGEINLYKMHIQDLMQRIQMDLQTDRDPYTNQNLCLIFMDPVSREINKLLTDAYNELYLNGDLIERYFVIKDCLHFELSHHSSGIQFADYIAGATLGYLQRRRFGSQLFNEHVRPLIRTCPRGGIMGCGIITIPTNLEVRQFFTTTFQVD